MIAIELEHKPKEALERSRALLDAQKAVHVSHGAPTYEERMGRLLRLWKLLYENKDAIAAALNKDYGNRPDQLSMAADVGGSIAPIKHIRSKLKSLMKSSKRGTTVPFNLFGARSHVQYQPKGSVGVIAPWNFPVVLLAGPLAWIMAAGNRVVLKPSEHAPETAHLLAELFAKYFSEEEVAVVLGDGEVAAGFCGLPWDHLLYTGGTSIASHVMRAAADNLVPVTLELGGKSPVIVGKDADLDHVAERVMLGKTFNAGQICIAPDYAMMDDSKVDEFVNKAKDKVAEMFPTMVDNPDYGAIINQRHYERVKDMIEDARNKGAEVIQVNPANENFDQQPHRKIPPTFIKRPTDDMLVMQEEIFGPVLPVVSTKDADEAIARVNASDRPLALYYFGDDVAEKDKVLERTTSGGVTVNDVITHMQQQELPFGGVGHSGQGSWQGEEGFRTFSHAKAVHSAMKWDPLKLAKMLIPPYGKELDKAMSMIVPKPPAS